VLEPGAIFAEESALSRYPLVTNIVALTWLVRPQARLAGGVA